MRFAGLNCLTQPRGTFRGRIPQHPVRMASKTFSREEVSRHNKDGDLWIIIKDKVYDVSKFAALHPGAYRWTWFGRPVFELPALAHHLFLCDRAGGKSALSGVAGKDATVEFSGLHRPYVLDKYQNLCIGSLAAAESKTEAKAGASKAAAATQFGEGIPFGDPNWYTTNASPYYTESHKEFRKRVREFVDKEMMPFVHEVRSDTIHCTVPFPESPHHCITLL